MNMMTNHLCELRGPGMSNGFQRLTTTASLPGAAKSSIAPCKR